MGLRCPGDEAASPTPWRRPDGDSLVPSALILEAEDLDARVGTRRRLDAGVAARVAPKVARKNDSGRCFTALAVWQCI